MAYNAITVLGITKARLNRLPSDTTLDEQLLTRIEAADAELKQKGINLIANDTADSVFLADFVTWKYNNRDKSAGMPEWLKLERRERFLSGKGRVNDT